MGEIDPSKTSMVYCAVGGRSRVAAQMLSGKGFKNVINVSGGYKAWQGDSAYGEETLGLELFTGKEDPAKILSVAYSLEQGLREFYLSMIASVQEASVKKLFQKLSDIETLHQERIFNQYKELSQEDITREEFEAGQVARAVEGGLTTREYLARFNADLTSPRDVIALAMSIEAQALDMYLRVSRNIVSEKGRAAIEDIADEERVHLASLGNLMDQV